MATTTCKMVSLAAVSQKGFVADLVSSFSRRLRTSTKSSLASSPLSPVATLSTQVPEMSLPAQRITLLRSSKRSRSRAMPTPLSRRPRWKPKTTPTMIRTTRQQRRTSKKHRRGRRILRQKMEVERQQRRRNLDSKIPRQAAEGAEPTQEQQQMFLRQ